jgi:hypothetical protein
VGPARQPVGTACQVVGGTGQSALWDLSVRSAVTHLSCCPWDPLSGPLVGPTYHSVGGAGSSASSDLSARLMVGLAVRSPVGYYELWKFWREKNRNIALRPRPNSRLRRYKIIFGGLLACVSCSSGGRVLLFEFVHEVVGSNSPALFFVLILSRMVGWWDP